MRNPPFLLVLVFISLLSSQANGQIELSSTISLESRNPYQIVQIPNGPWGDLEYFPLLLEPPDFYISLYNELESWPDGTVWKFKGEKPEFVAGFLTSAGLDALVISRLMQPQFLSHNEEAGFFEIRPPEDVILGLGPAQRASLYLNLEPRDRSNPFFQAFSLPAGGIRSVTRDDCGVSERNLSLIEKLTFRKGETYRFSDISYVLSQAADETERWRILKTISRDTSLALRLRLSEKSNLAELTRYWGAGGRNKDIFPLLESVTATQGVDRLDIAHLLPPTPRKLLHTYPSPQGYGIADDLPDCFWTAYSFFSENPPERHLDFVGHVFHERYQPANLPRQFGDLIMISDPETKGWIHACNYIAADLVFTKNGKSLGRPWVIAPLGRIAREYHSVKGLQVTFHRLKPEYQR